MNARVAEHRVASRRLAGRAIIKMNGIGNVIAILDLRREDLVVSATEARAICATPDLSFDQLMTIHDPVEPETDAHLRIYNADGSASDACGNGTRCVAWYMTRDTDHAALTLTTATTRLACTKAGADRVTVDMGAPRFAWDRIPLREPVDPRGLDFNQDDLGPGFAVSMGNPHVVFFVPDAAAIDLASVGPSIENAAIFPEGVNVSFAEIIDRETVKLRVWERGAGATLACGTGACAALVAAASTQRTGRKAHVDLPGGRLLIDWRDDDHVLMTGPVAFELETRLAPDFAADRAA